MLHIAQNLTYQVVQAGNSIESNKDVREQDDFYNAVNKEWLSNTKLENGYVSYGTFEEVCGKVNQGIYNIILYTKK